MSSNRLKAQAWDTVSIVTPSDDAETDPLEPELFRHHLEERKDLAKHLRIAVMERDPKNSPAGMRCGLTSDSDQPEAQLLIRRDEISSDVKDFELEGLGYLTWEEVEGFCKAKTLVETVKVFAYNQGQIF